MNGKFKYNLKILGNRGKKVKQSLHTSQVAHQTRAYPGFCGMK